MPHVQDVGRNVDGMCGIGEIETHGHLHHLAMWCVDKEQSPVPAVLLDCPKLDGFAIEPDLRHGACRIDRDAVVGVRDGERGVVAEVEVAQFASDVLVKTLGCSVRDRDLQLCLGALGRGA